MLHSDRIFQLLLDKLVEADVFLSGLEFEPSHEAVVQPESGLDFSCIF
jgi:hypothetical protein